MRNILLSILGAVVLVGFISGCTATAKAPSGRTASASIKPAK